MNLEDLRYYNQVPLEKLIEQEFNSNTINKHIRTLIYSKARQQPCTYNSVTMVVNLFQRDAAKIWLEILKMFTTLQFQLVFSICIHHIKTYPALIQALCKLGDTQRQALFQNNIQKALDGQISNSNICFSELWDIYLMYLKEWSQKIASRTIFGLQKIQNRLSKQNNIYARQLNDIMKIQFINILSRIIKIHEQAYMKRLQLRKFWKSIPYIITYLKQLLSDQGLIDLLVQKLRVKTLEVGRQYRRQLQQQKQSIILFFINTCQVSILQQIYLQRSKRLATQLVMTHVIDYQKYQQDNIQELLQLQNSLIYDIKSDDLPSLIQQLLLSLSKHIPNFLTQFINQCQICLSKSYIDQISTSDIILKLCILNKQIIIHNASNPDGLNIKFIVDQLTVLTDSRSQMVQIKTLKLMHCFKQILPQKYFVNYHQIIFRILKSIINSEIQKNNQHSIIQSNPLFPFYRKPSIYTKISYVECIQILQQETQKPQDAIKMQKQVRRRKFLNQRAAGDMMQKKILQIFNKFIELIKIEGYCEQQNDILRILMNFLQKYPSVVIRNTQDLISLLCRQFMTEFNRLSYLVQYKRCHQKLTQILHCIQIVLQQITQQTYFNCQQYLIPIISKLKQPHSIQIDQQLITFISILIHKANMITPQLNNFIIYSKQTLKKNNSSIVQLQKIIKELCTPKVAKSVKQQWNGLIEFITHLFYQYISYIIQNSVIIHYQKDWNQTVHLAQLFFQTYQEEYQTKFSLSQVLLKIQFQLQKTNISQQIYQLLMTVHHINPKCKLYPFHKLSNLNLYTQRYTLHLAQITMIDIFRKNILARIFDFSISNNEVYPFLDEFIHVRSNIKEIYFNRQSTPNDTLPFSKINTERYILSALQCLYKDKLLDIQQFTQLKNKLLDERYLIKQSLFD